MKTPHLFKLVLLPLFALAASAVRAEDIDLYSGATAVSGPNPNVLVIVDNTSSNDASFTSICPFTSAPANLPNSTLLDMVYCSLYGALEVIKTQPTLLNKLNVGLMSGGSGLNKGGAMYYPATSPFNLPTMNLTNIAAFQSIISAGIPKALGNAKLDGDMQEAWAFFTGNVGPRSGTSYVSHIGSLSCQRSFIILIGAATKQGRPDTGSGFGSAAELAAAGATPSQQVQINTAGTPNFGPNTQDDGAWIDEWARFFNQTDFNTSATATDQQNIVTYTISAGANGDQPAYTQVLQSTGHYGGGGSFSGSDYYALRDALLRIFYEVQAVNSVFASPGLPVNTNAQGTYLNQTFFGTFRPNGDGTPRWMGNLKQYQFGVSTGPDPAKPTSPTLFLADASWPSGTGYAAGTNANPALNSQTGFFSPTSISYWTSKDITKLPDITPPGGFWSANPHGSGLGFDLPDGEYVEKGGVSQQSRLQYLIDTYPPATTATTSRNLYTCLGSGGSLCSANAALSSMPFSTSNANLTSTVLGISNPISTVGVTNVLRTSATGQVTLTLAQTPSPAIGNPTTIVLTGSTGAAFDGPLATLSPSTSGTTVTYTLPAEYPPTPPTGTYTATGSLAGSTPVTSLTRSANAGLITVTAALTDPKFGSATNVAVNDVINVSDTSANCTANGYCATGTVLGVSGSNVTYTMSESPSVYGGSGGSGQLYIGASCKTSGTVTCTSFGASNTNAPGAGQANLPGLVRGKNGVLTANQILMVNFPGGTSFKTLPAVNNTANVTNASPSNYNGGFTVLAVGNACSVTETHTDGTARTYTGTATSGSTFYTLCLDLGAGFALTPPVSGNKATATTTATKQTGTATRAIATLTRGASTCPASATATATVTTLLPHGFTTGEAITISTSNAGANEGAYSGTQTITVLSSTQFTYPVTTTPGCTDTKSGMSISYQQSSGGVNAASLINWARGQDNIGDEQSPGSGITVRPSIHGDVVHSRPAVVNYGGTTGVVVFYGANDGTFRAINGNQPRNASDTTKPKGACTVSSDCSIGGVPPGGELWSFVPKEFFYKLQRLYNNSPIVQLAGTPSNLNGQYKDYYFDGPTSVYQDTALGKTYIYLTARRGGRVIYAIDVSSPTAPKYLWSMGCPKYTSNTGCDSGFSELGQTWSQPKLAFLNGYLDTSSKPKPVLIFGAGYDGNGYDPDGTPYAGKEDLDTPGTDVMGRGIFIVDAVTGAQIWRASAGGGSDTCTGNPCTLSGMTYSIPADITLVDTNADGVVDRAYAADTGGNIWRVDFEASTPGGGPSTWQVTKFAALGGPAGAAVRRKFLFAPDVVVTKNFTAVLAGTGDREHPLSSQTGAYNTVNRFYMIQDTKTGMSAQSSPAWSPVVDNASSSDTSWPSPAPSPQTLFNASTQAYDLTSSTCSGATPCKGFYLVLRQNSQYAIKDPITGVTTYGPKTGEQVVNAPTTIGGLTYFGTNQPNTAPASATSCSANLGNARGYQVSFLTGSGGFTDFTGGGLPPSPVAGLVTVNVNGADTVLPFILGGGGGAISGVTGGGSLDTSCSGPDCKSQLGGGKPKIPIKVKKKRTYWYREVDR